MRNTGDSEHPSSSLRKGDKRRSDELSIRERKYAFLSELQGDFRGSSSPTCPKFICR